MKKNKWYTISVFIIICVLLNLAGKCIAGYFRLPLWLDSLGTVAATYVCGPDAVLSLELLSIFFIL